MDSEAIKIILKLQEENILLRRGVHGAILALHARETPPGRLIPEYGDDDIRVLFAEISSVLLEVPPNRTQQSDFIVLNTK